MSRTAPPWSPQPGELARVAWPGHTLDGRTVEVWGSAARPGRRVWIRFAHGESRETFAMTCSVKHLCPLIRRKPRGKAP